MGSPNLEASQEQSMVFTLLPEQSTVFAKFAVQEVNVWCNKISMAREFH